jgi:DNA helicase IV
VLSSAFEEEQKKVTWLYGLLDVAREKAERSVRRQIVGGAGFQARVEREVVTREQGRQLALYAAVEHGLCFGRIDRRNGTLYVGRMGLRDEKGEPALIDWRAPAARAFYIATAGEPGDLVRRRHIHTRGRTVVDLDDEVFDLDAMTEADQTALVGEAALLASLRRDRTGRMGDIVATIQAEQDEVIRAAFQGVLVVQGGPGTGKTVAALHRAAYLLYTHRETLSRRGVLVIGPNPTFLRYIERVLPGLGETDVALCTLGDLHPGLHTELEDAPEAAVLKGSLEMAGMLKDALAARQRVPEQDVTIEADGMPATLSVECAELARARARALRAPHNVQRRLFAHEVLAALAQDQVERLERSTDEPLAELLADEGLDAELRELLAEPSSLLRDEHDIELAKEALWADPAVRELVEELWPALTPERFLADFYREAVGSLHREPDAPWTVSDVPLLDEAAELLGVDDVRSRAAARAEEAGRAEEERYARGVLEISGITELDAAELAAWQREDRAPVTSAERLADREWAYGHVIVDEAQELSAMAWRAVMRRVPSRSLTIVGDLAQTGSPAGARSWAEMLAPYVQDRWREQRLLVNYRTPASIMRVAEKVLTMVDPEAVAPRSVRDDGDPPITVPFAELERAVAGERGKVGVITSAKSRTEALRILPEGGLDEDLVVLTVKQSKGLEFDTVVVVDPAGILAESPQGGHDLYVALTRATRRLMLVGELPDVLSSGRQRL